MLFLREDLPATGYRVPSLRRRRSPRRFRAAAAWHRKFPIRTTPEGSIKPYEGKPKAEISKLDAIEFFTANSIHAADRSQLMNG